MVRYTLAVRGVPRTPASALVVEENEINIFQGEQFEERFLLEVNSRGEVRTPVQGSTARTPAAWLTLYIRCPF